MKNVNSGRSVVSHLDAMREVAVLFLVAITGMYTMAASQCYRLCRTGRTHGMKSEECYNVSLRTIPECLGRDVEVPFSLLIWTR